MEDKNIDKGCCCHTSKHRSEKEYKDLMNRLSRIEDVYKRQIICLEKDVVYAEES